uniref:Putative DNA binding, helix-turn-helix domain containing protein n=1 Tax=viral metagenome TaxID=1070528 RepID=A0A6H1ZIC4_9ZZZZ
MLKTIPENTKRNKKLVALKNKGWSFNQLAKEFDISPQRAWKIFKRYERRIKKSKKIQIKQEMSI